MSRARATPAHYANAPEVVDVTRRHRVDDHGGGTGQSRKCNICAVELFIVWNGLAGPLSPPPPPPPLAARVPFQLSALAAK